KEKHANPLTREIHIAIAPTKNNDRMEWFVEKAVEIGVSSITPIICKNSERVKLKQERFLKVAISAMKQSNRLYLPIINEPMKLMDFMAKDDSESKLIAHCEEEKKSDLSQLSIGKSVSILIGPEGDFSRSEIEKALEENYIPTSLGNSRLRTETAGIVACTLLNQ
ncbi:MAG: RNA methyltransferase, partial [Flavobacteriales bacterium]|nr:RNA methyltransferase [Flavobacteriales bacterium]